MDEQEQPQNEIQEEQNVQMESTPLPEPPSHKKLIIGIVAVFVLVVAGIAGAYFVLQQKVQTAGDTDSVTSVNNIDKTANWNIYIDKEYGFEFKYPHDWTAERIANSSDGIIDVYPNSDALRGLYLEICPLGGCRDNIFYPEVEMGIEISSKSDSIKIGDFLGDRTIYYTSDERTEFGIIFIDFVQTPSYFSEFQINVRPPFDQEFSKEASANFDNYPLILSTFKFNEPQIFILTPDSDIESAIVNCEESFQYSQIYKCFAKLVDSEIANKLTTNKCELTGASRQCYVGAIIVEAVSKYKDEKNVEEATLTCKTLERDGFVWGRGSCLKRLNPEEYVVYGEQFIENLNFGYSSLEDLQRKSASDNQAFDHRLEFYDNFEKHLQVTSIKSDTKVVESAESTILDHVIVPDIPEEDSEDVRSSDAEEIMKKLQEQFDKKRLQQQIDKKRATTQPNETDSVFIDVHASPVSVKAVEVRGWDAEKKEEFLGTVKEQSRLKSGQDLDNFARGVLVEDENIESAFISEKRIDVTYKMPAKFLGIFATTTLKVKASTKTGDGEEISADKFGRVKVKFPWYRFLYSVPDEVSKKELEEELSSGVAYKENSYAPNRIQNQARIFAVISFIMKTKHDTAMGLSAISNKISPSSN